MLVSQLSWKMCFKCNWAITQGFFQQNISSWKIMLTSSEKIGIWAPQSVGASDFHMQNNELWHFWCVKNKSLLKCKMSQICSSAAIWLLSERNFWVLEHVYKPWICSYHCQSGELQKLLWRPASDPGYPLCHTCSLFRTLERECPKDPSDINADPNNNGRIEDKQCYIHWKVAVDLIGYQLFSWCIVHHLTESIIHCSSIS